MFLDMMLTAWQKRYGGIVVEFGGAGVGLKGNTCPGCHDMCKREAAKKLYANALMVIESSAKLQILPSTVFSLKRKESQQRRNQPERGRLEARKKMKKEGRSGGIRQREIEREQERRNTPRERRNNRLSLS